MYKIGDYLVYKKDVCKVKEIKLKYLRDMDYYILSPIIDDSLLIQVPVGNKQIRNLITKREVDEIIVDIPNVSVIECDSKGIENEYKALMSSGTHRDLIKIIKTTYLRNKERTLNNKKTTDKDNYYFNQAELYLYNEFSVVLGMSYEDTKNYIIERVQNIS